MRFQRARVFEENELFFLSVRVLGTVSVKSCGINWVAIFFCFVIQLLVAFL